MKGNPGGPGRPRRRTEYDNMRLLLNFGTEERLGALVSRLWADALRGEYRAINVLAKYYFGQARTIAPTPSELATDEAAGVDPLWMEIAVKRSLDEGWNLNGPDSNERDE